MRIRRRGPRQQTTIARAERDGALVCSDVLVVVHSAAGRLGTKPHDDFTAWFYGALEPDLAHDLEGLALAARADLPAGDVGVDLVLYTPGGELRLERCRLGLPIRCAGQVPTLEFRVAHPGAAAARRLRAAA